jgi:putative ABC transport system permease protein
MMHSLREHAAHPGVFALAVLTLALGIAGATTMFGTLSGMGSGLPRIEGQEDVGRVFATEPASGTTRGSVSFDEYLSIQSAATAFADLAAFASSPVLLQEAAGETSTEVLRVSQNFFRTLGFGVVAGRQFRTDECRPGAPLVAVVSERFARARWGVPTAAPGQHLRLSGTDHLVVGVLPDSNWFPAKGGAAIWVPLAPVDAADGTAAGVYLVGRLGPGETWARAGAQLHAAGRRLVEEHPDTRRGWSLAVIPLREDAMKRTGFGLFGLLGPAVVVLLIACGNVANLLLARGTRREREMAVRAALGASRFALVRERVAESAWMAGSAGLLGLLLAYWGTGGARAWIDRFKPGLADDVQLSAPVLAFALVVTALTPLVFALLPAWLATRQPFTEALHESGRHRASRRGPYGGRDLLVIVEMALAVVLVLTAGLFGTFVWEMNHIDRHFESSQVLAASLDLSRVRTAGGEGREAAFVESVLEAVRAVPGVRSAAVGQAPLTIDERPVTVVIEGCQATVVPAVVTTTSVGPRYFETLGLRLGEGRPIDERDQPGAPATAVVSEWLARRCWPGGSALGRRLRLGPAAAWTTVVGVVPDAMTSSALGRFLPQAPVYLAAAQQRTRAGTLLVRAKGNPLAILRPVRDAVRAVDGNQPLSELSPLDALLSGKFAEGWLLIGLMESFAALALALAAVGVFGVTSYSVAERTREFGVRIAIGASRGDILGLVMRRALTVVGIGTVAAAVLTLAVTRVMFAELILVGTHSPAGFVAIAGVLSSVAILACLVPAARATRVDPVVALRAE